MYWTQFLGFIVSMLAITNPLGSLAVFLGMTTHKTEHERKQTAWVTTITVFSLLILITWVGIPILNVFGISLPAFEITGGIIILIRGLSMLHSKEAPTVQSAEQLLDDPKFKKVSDSIGVVPLGIPIIAGPGAMTNAIIYSNQFPKFFERLYISLGIFFVSAVIGAVLFYSYPIARFFGETGIKVMTRIMGLLLASMAMSMIIHGLKTVFPAWL